MFTINVRKLFRKAFGPWVMAASPRSKPRSGFRPRLEVLEDRITPANIPPVNATADDPNGPIQGVVTLRDDIGAAMKPGNAGSTISFAQGLTGTISLMKALPPLRQNVTISGPGTGGIEVAAGVQTILLRSSRSIKM